MVASNEISDIAILDILKVSNEFSADLNRVNSEDLTPLDLSKDPRKLKTIQARAEQFWLKGLEKFPAILEQRIGS
jgi:hypothetical protein